MLGHAQACHLVNSIEALQTTLNFGNLVQISMDGPNVNWSAYNTVSKKIKTDYGHELLNIGSCGLHQVHNAFRAGSQATQWNMDSFLCSLYSLFKNVPARREDFTTHSESTVFPLKFAPHRWVENGKALARARVMIKPLQAFVTAVTDNKVKNNPTCQSYDTVVQFLNDPLLEAKLVFMSNVCKPLETFLTMFQSDSPCVPFLFKDIEDVLTKFMKMFIKPEVLKKKDACDIDVKDSKNCLSVKEVKIGIETQKLVNASKAKPLEKLDFHSHCLTFLKTIVSRLLTKSPLNYSLTKYMQCLSPLYILSNSQDASTLFRRAIVKLEGLKWLEMSELDTILEEYEYLVSQPDALEAFQSFDRRKDSETVDKLFHKLCSENVKCSKLWPVIKIMLVVSHGQASVERGFSQNKQILETNMQRESLVGKRIVKDFIFSIGGIENFTVTKQLKLDCSKARARYDNYLLAKKTTDAETSRGKKRKLIQEEIVQIKKSKTLLEKTVRRLKEESDNSDCNAEKEKNVSKKLALFSTGTALRKSVKDKEEQISELEKSLEKKEALLKST